MKKILLGLVLVFSVALLSACDDIEGLEDLDDLTSRIEALETALNTAEADLDTAEQAITDLETDLETAENTITGLESTVSDLETNLQAEADKVTVLEEAKTMLEEKNAMLEAELNTTMARIKNALNRDAWATRKVKYNPDFSSYEAEYCFGIFDEDWSLETASDYTHNTGLKFVITVESIQWGTEIFVKDSCGNYSEFIYEASSFALYSVPAGYFEVGKTYEVVLYKEMYFTTYQLGLLPLADMGDFGAYPEDLSGIIVTEVE